MHTIGKIFGILCRQFTAFLNHELKGAEVNAQQLMYLGALFQNDGVMQDDLAREFYIDKGAVARALRDLEKKGIIRRHEEDHRAKRVYLTGASQKLPGSDRENPEKVDACLQRRPDRGRHGGLGKALAHDGQPRC